MKVGWAVLVFWLTAGIGIFSVARESLDFRWSAEMAREYDSDKGGKFVGDFGDKEGPFAHVGEIVADAAGVDSFIPRINAHNPESHPGSDDTDLIYRIHFFLNERGNSYGIVRQLPESEEVNEPEGVRNFRGFPSEDGDEDENDERPARHVQLCEAAKLAIAEGDINFMKALLQAAFQINEVIDFESKDTALFCAALYNQPAMAKFLIENGASRDMETEWGGRAFDHAYEEGYLEVCEALRKPAEKEEFIGPYPKGLLNSLDMFGARSPERIRFLTVNGKDPDEDLMRYFRKHWPKVRKGSRAKEVSRGQARKDKSNSTYQDPQTGEYGLLVALKIAKSDTGDYEWSNRQATGPFLSGGGVRGGAVKRYGYWISTQTASWDE